MQIVVTLIQAACILLAAVILGNWYLKDIKRIKREGRPWYTVYLSIPGLLIIGLLLLLPLVKYLK